MKRQNGANPLIQLIAVNLFGGSVLGAILATALVVFDIANLRTLILSSDAGITALILIFVCSASTFSTAAIAGAVMLLAASDDDNISGDAEPEVEFVPDRH